MQKINDVAKDGNNASSQRLLLEFLAKILKPIEQVIKIPLFGCKMCGQCVLHSTGLVCPMTCPKEIRNGPCGGVRGDGSCEVNPELTCVWVTAYQRSKRLTWKDEFHDLRPPVDIRLKDSASWINWITRKDQVVSGCEIFPLSALDVIDNG